MPMPCLYRIITWVDIENYAQFIPNSTCVLKEWKLSDVHWLCIYWRGDPVGILSAQTSAPYE